MSAGERRSGSKRRRRLIYRLLARSFDAAASATTRFDPTNRIRRGRLCFASAKASACVPRDCRLSVKNLSVDAAFFGTFIRRWRSHFLHSGAAATRSCIMIASFSRKHARARPHIAALRLRFQLFSLCLRVRKWRVSAGLHVASNLAARSTSAPLVKLRVQESRRRVERAA